MTSEEYLRNQFDKLKQTKYGFSVTISDGEGNYTNSYKNGEWIYYYREYEQNKLCGSCKF